MVVVFFCRWHRKCICHAEKIFMQCRSVYLKLQLMQCRRYAHSILSQLLHLPYMKCMFYFIMAVDCEKSLIKRIINAVLGISMIIVNLFVNPTLLLFFLLVCLFVCWSVELFWNSTNKQCLQHCFGLPLSLVT